MSLFIFLLALLVAGIALLLGGVTVVGLVFIGAGGFGLLIFVGLLVVGLLILASEHPDVRRNRR